MLKKKICLILILEEVEKFKQFQGVIVVVVKYILN